MTSAQIVVLRNAALSGDSRLSGMISLAQEQLCQDAFGDDYDYAVALLVLHWYAKESRGGNAGAVASETEGRLSRSFDAAQGGKSGDDLSTTHWGQELQALCKGSFFLPRNRMT